MNFAQIREYDVANGPGIRVSFFVTGCTHKCYNCFNPEYQDFDFGDTWTKDTTKMIINYLNKDQISGLSIIGGEPFQNAKDLTKIIKDIKKEVNKDIWVWSGYTFDEIINDQVKKELLEEIDVLVDGRFVERLKDLTLKFRGSSNQRIIDVKKSLENDKIVLHYSN
ncbi:MAG TPA: anaerobic ribonucleoside-triphosphate reductase activating protein [Tissierellaceae bacterium]